MGSVGVSVSAAFSTEPQFFPAAQPLGDPQFGLQAGTHSPSSHFWPAPQAGVHSAGRAATCAPLLRRYATFAETRVWSRVAARANP